MTTTFLPKKLDQKPITEDLGMLFIPELNVFCKIFRDSKGLYVRLPNDRKHKAYLEETKE